MSTRRDFFRAAVALPVSWTAFTNTLQAAGSDDSYWQMVQREFPLDDDKGKQVRQHFFFGDYKDIGGCRRYTKVKAYRDGKQVMEAELLDVKTFDKIDDSEFDKP